ncbi:uncharacterized protein LOC106176274 [Lingula anatina]|uniref:Uncharacterized protein LOC106176274 n=1 Tax=Lingula anatina TaxID=7574 RepID=A0A1S3JVC8_LINAN|nr:uncharacterized protein LOC106176274 [Lingula anatina]|eukprot:XP_013414044.1 uncharacterized protein LOC106176274 [Lingula anatina]
MLPTVSEKSAESGVTVITDGGSSRRDSAEMKASYKKYIIVAVAVIVVVAVAVGGTLGAVHMSNKDVWKEYHLRLTDKQGKKVDEKVQVDLKDNITVYNVNNEKFHVAMDNSRSLVVYKMEMNNKFACYLTPMKKYEETDSKDVANTLEQPNTVQNTTDDVEDDDDQKSFEVNTSPIKDKSILSPRMQEFCRNLEAYWLSQKDVDGASTQTPAGGIRQKRACSWYRCIRIQRICFRIGSRRYCFYRITRGYCKRCY